MWQWRCRCPRANGAVNGADGGKVDGSCSDEINVIPTRCVDVAVIDGGGVASDRVRQWRCLRPCANGVCCTDGGEVDCGGKIARSVSSPCRVDITVIDDGGGVSSSHRQWRRLCPGAYRACCGDLREVDCSGGK